jgi:hypothetical protein
MEVVDVRYIGSDDQYQTYAPADVSLINTVSIVGTYGAPNDYIEYFIKDLGNVVLSSNYYATQYSLNNSAVDPITGTTTQLYLDPENDARILGYNRGIVNVKYNFFAKQLLSAPDPTQNFWIKEVSTSRTEIKVARQDLSNTQLSNAFNEFNAVLSADAYYPTFYLNFGADIQIIGINAVYVEEEGSGYVIFKLYEPLPTQFDVKSTFWVVTQAADSAEFNVSINVTPEAIADSVPIKGANFKVEVKDKVGQTTPYYNYASLLTTSVTSSYQQLQSMMQEKGIRINVDYSNFSNFIHFSSATERLYNFVYKVQQIESASAGLVQTNTSTAKVLLQNQIDSTITNFDGYEYYLYFNSGSTTWPKRTNTQPYILYSATSSQVANWLGNTGNVPTATTMSMYWSSSYYDNLNKDLLLHATPTYILDDSANAPYLTFLNMIGQHFDNIWIYLKDVTNHYSAENNPFVGISIDQVADALRSFGVQLYTNTSITDNIYYSLLGINQTGSALPVTSSLYSTSNIASSSLYPLAGRSYLTSSLLLPPFGDEKINRYVITFVTGSGGKAFQTLPNSQITGEIYKRLYHNLAYLLKTRGTERGVKALITTFGVPGDILTPHEYGGYNIYQTSGIQEISSTKIITGSVLQLSSSLLSPFTTIQYYQNNTDKSSNDIQVAFSPADSINANITSSGYITSSTQPGYFNIMQYIGAPDLQYSSSYIPLVQLGDNYFSKTYTDRYNVWDFIRVIKYYNNSLFKMVRDWVPARTSPASGIVIQSHMLERNKYPRHEPTVVFEDQATSIEMVSITGSTPSGYLYNTSYTASIPVQYSSASNYLAGKPGFIPIISNTGVENYNGQYSGSTIIAATNYFNQIGVSSYNYPWTSSVAPSEHGGQNIMFTTYSLNYLLNNVTSSVISQRFLELDYNNNQIIPTNYGLVTQSLSQSNVIGPYSQSQQTYSQYSQIQDYNYFLRRSMIPRYSGSFLSGLYYNVYTPQNATYSGDISYGNSPVINYYTNKLGLFTQIQSSSFIPGAVNASLAYQADVSGGLSELNQNNNNWQDIQNIFVAGTSLTIKQFDNKKYTNQVATDGIKAIYNSGYNYTPELYFNTSSDQRLYFQYNGNTAGIQTFLAQNAYSLGNISGSVTSPPYSASLALSSGAGVTYKSKGYIYNIFNQVVSDTFNYYTTGSASTGAFPTYSVSYAAQRTFNINCSIAVAFPSASQEVTYSLNLINKASNQVLGSATSGFKSSTTAGGTSNGGITTQTPISVSSYGSSSPITTYYGPFSVTSSGVPSGVYGNSGSYIDTMIFYNLNGGSSGARFATNTYDGPSGTNPSISSVVSTYNFGPMDTPNPIIGLYSSYKTAPTSNLTTTLNLPLSVNSNFAANDQVTIQVTQSLSASNANFTSSLNQGSFTVSENVSQGSYSYATSSTALIRSIANPSSGSGLITLSSNLSAYYSAYQFIPSFVSGTLAYTSSLYNQYGDVNTAFAPQLYDKIILQDIYGVTQDLNVYTASFSGSFLQIQTVPAINQSWAVSSSLVQKFLLLRRYNDEQNVILTFNKPLGQTSYGFLIPETINPQTIKNINTLQAAVQSQLLSTQTAVTSQ